MLSLLIILAGASVRRALIHWLKLFGILVFVVASARR